VNKGIHPEYSEAKAKCGCGNESSTRLTKSQIHVEIRSVCHPFYSGKQRYADTAGRIERFQKKYRSNYRIKVRVTTLTCSTYYHAV